MSVSQSDEMETKSRGRPPVQEKWTQVISLSHDNLLKPKLHVIATDLQTVQYLPKIGSMGGVSGRNEDYKLRFFPPDFKEEHPDPKMEEHQLEVDKLKEYGIIITHIRKQLENKAEELFREELEFQRSMQNGIDINRGGRNLKDDQA